MLPGFAAATVTRERATLVDDGHGNLAESWDSPDTVEIVGCSVQPGASTENLQNRDTTLIAYTVYAPADADVVATDRILIGATPFAIDGEPARWSTGLSLDHMVLLLKRWEG